MKKGERGDIVLILTIGTLVVLGVSSLISVILPKTNQSTNTKAEDRSQRYCNLNRGEAACKPTCTRCDGKVCNYHAELEPWCQDGGKDLGGCLDSTECGGTNTPPPNCPGKLDSTGACNPACCDPNVGTSCPQGQECKIQNGYCGANGGGWSCAGFTSKVKRACTGNTCAWVTCKADDTTCCDSDKDPRCMYCDDNDKCVGTTQIPNDQRSNSCFNLSAEVYADKEADGYRFNAHLLVGSPEGGGDGHIQLFVNGGSKGWNKGWNRGVNNPFDIEPQFLDSPYLGSGSKTMNYAVKVDECNKRGNYLNLTCEFIVSNGLPKVNGPSCTCKNCSSATPIKPPVVNPPANPPVNPVPATGNAISGTIKLTGTGKNYITISQMEKGQGGFTIAKDGIKSQNGATWEWTGSVKGKVYLIKALMWTDTTNWTNIVSNIAEVTAPANNVVLEINAGGAVAPVPGLPAGKTCSDYNGLNCPADSCTWYRHVGCFPKNVKNNLPANIKCKDLDKTGECEFFNACKVADGQCDDYSAAASGTCKGAGWGVCQNTKENGVPCAWHSYAECYKKGTKVELNGKSCTNLTHNDTSSECDDTNGCAWDTARGCYTIGARCEARNEASCKTLSGQGCKWGEKLYKCFDPGVKISLPASLTCNMLNVVDECDVVKDCQKSADGKSCIPVPSGRGVSDNLTQWQVAFLTPYGDDLLIKLGSDPAILAALKAKYEKDITTEFMANARNQGITFYMISGYGELNKKNWPIQSIDSVNTNIYGGFYITFSYNKEPRPSQLPNSPLLQYFCMTKIPGIPLCVPFSN